MGKVQSYFFLLAVFLGVLFLPLAGSFLATGAPPPGYGEFPVTSVEPPPGFSLPYFLGLGSVALFITVFLAFPRIFGFKKTVPQPRRESGKFPWWFWVAIPLTLVFWVLMWTRKPFLFSAAHYAYVPLAWGFIMLLDGIVYKRNAGRSLMAQKPNLFKVMTLVSTLSWFVFEYLNFFVLGNWYYPNAGLIFTEFGNIIWFFLGYTTVLTGIFQWYSLLRTFPRLTARYSEGPKIKFNKTVLIVVLIFGLLLEVAMGMFPRELFWGVWVSLVPSLGAALLLAKKPNVLDGLKKGWWVDVNLVALGTLLNGLFWEMWNFGSEWFVHGWPTTPGYWRYSVPFVDVLHLFSEMPLLGYWGYLLFGVNCWVLWNLSGVLLGFNDRFDQIFQPVEKNSK